MLEFLSDIILFFVGIVDKLGYLGIFIGMILESSLIPLPSEAVLIPAGALIARGEMTFLPVFFAALFGSLVGSILSYLFALFFGRVAIDLLIDKYGKFLLISRSQLKKTDDFFIRYGGVATFTGRLIFGARHVISLVAGFAKMNISKFVFFTLIGAALWNAILIYTGIFFQNNHKIILENTKIILFIASFLIILFYAIYRRKINSSRQPR
ncbi:DedA family protein [Candidatus Pacearchaeota archaeon]|nr:DedA family protein [Candidatus Pacearchaeota archaeon]